MPDFAYLTFREGFEDHQAQAGRPVVTEAEAEDVWYGPGLIVPNRKSQRAPYLLVGTTEGNKRQITVVIFATPDPATWLAYTAWDTKESDLRAPEGRRL